MKTLEDVIDKISYSHEIFRPKHKKQVGFHFNLSLSGLSQGFFLKKVGRNAV